METEHILIFEPLVGGHRAEFLGHLLNCIRRNNCEDRRYTFVLGALPSGFDDLSNITLRELPDEERAALCKADGALGGFVIWRILHDYLKKLKPDHLLILDLTWLELPFCFQRPACPFSGILFVQYPELCNVAKTGFRTRLKYWWKEMKTARFLRSAHPEKIFLLNGAHSCDYLNKRFKTATYVPLPDPVPELAAESGFDVRQTYGIGEDCRLFLFFGSMSPRKGVEPLLQAIQSLPEQAARRCTFLFFGRPEPDYAERYQRVLESFRSNRPDVQLLVDEQFLTSPRMRAMFEQADWILMPYTRPEYSSGILAHAAAAATPVIAPRAGLVGRQVRDHGLGVTVPSGHLTKVIEAAVESPFSFDETARQAFVESSNPDRFATMLLEI